MYYLFDGPKRGFVREELMVVPPDTQLPRFVFFKKYVSQLLFGQAFDYFYVLRCQKFDRFFCCRGLFDDESIVIFSMLRLF